MSQIDVTTIRKSRNFEHLMATFRFDCSSSYATGGYAIDPAILGLAEIDWLEAAPKSGYVFVPDYDNNKIKVFRSAGFTPAGSVSQPTFTGAAASMNDKVENWSIQNALGADADVATSMTVDQDTGPTNDDRIDTYAAVGAGAWSYTENNEIDVPRNVCIAIWNDDVSPHSMEEAAFSALVTGTYRGAVQSDTISETFTAGNKAIAAAKFRWKYGVKPFSTITNVVITGLTANQNGLKIGVGIGRLLGVPQDTKNGTAADFLKIVKGSANLAAVAYNDTHKTLDVGAFSDNDDFDIWYLTTGLKNYTPGGTVSQPTLTGSAVAAAVLVEVTAGVNLAAVTGVRCFAVGR